MHTTKECNQGYNNSNCQFYVNAYWCKKDNKIYITKIDNQHNYALINNIKIVATYYQRLTPKMHDDIKLLASCRVHAEAIIEVLQKKNLGKYIHICNVYNIIQMNRIQKKTISDAGSMYLELIKHQQADPTFYINACIESPTGMFSENLFDVNIIELEQLIAGLEWTKTIECWYLNRLVKSVTIFESEPVISLMSNEEFNELGYAIHIDFSYLKDICRNHIFTKHISREMMHREQ
ncbi:15791_t:CDS:2 [Cetraspora pellucida]|uniref:15791_t:CDS:1 n=1 Tax=Cetraspora pellucida TaxID=1433469 RepID=A0A9N9E3W0_9GLOM|nr:15791_t:CDS:2 [Cetraspora pellucida]